MQSTHNLPKIEELYKEGAKAGDPFLELVNSPIKEGWVKTRNVSGKTYVYIPIERIMWLLTRVFGAFYEIEVLRESVMLNSIAITCRLHYCIPGTTTWLFQDGVGAEPVKVDQGQPASNLSAIKSNAIETGIGAALSTAVRNAAAKIGVTFGLNLNRDGGFDYSGTYSSTYGAEEQPSTPQFYAPNQPQQAPQATPQFYAPTAQPEPAQQPFYANSQAVQPASFNPQPNFQL